ncbi:MAG TPA: acyl-CoA dehydrogenase [Candidatus Hydrogenedentes bacterium]|nr:acyl-CoA dehydrogenase [Candidatus Hydrogenedentota bacterium]HPG65993.1 acyl-CoA dehydrogenase [Candidatus Hydrogenedentota bacterium]
MMLFNPKAFDGSHLDASCAEIVRKTIAFFEGKGKAKLKEDDRNRTWYADFLECQTLAQAFATFLTPQAYGEGDARWDTWRISHYNEVLAFYGLHYWYAWQVSILGLGPIWMSKNEALKQQAAQYLLDGEVFAFGLSERTHGADIYSTEMSLAPQPDGAYLANGEKYYIGNGNTAKMVSTFGKMADTGDYVFFIANYQNPRYECVQNVVNSQSYVSQYRLADYPVTEADILSKGTYAWDCALNTVNVGKFNLGWASIGICTHALYEAVRHAANRRLYNMYVTDFPHVKRMLTDAYARLVAMRLFAMRASDYMRVASPEDRRYLLYNPTVKMKVTTQGEDVINLLWDVIAAKGFERDTYFEMAARDIRALPKLEGTVHVNVALILKFIANYFFNPKEFPEIGRQDQATNDNFLFDQGPAKGLGKVQFHDYNIAYNRFDVPNVQVFREQIATLKEMFVAAGPSGAQQKDIDFLLNIGEMFTLVVYGQLILENAALCDIGNDLVDQIFDFMVRDFSKIAVELLGKAATTEAQIEFCRRMIRKPASDAERFARVWSEVHALKDAYEMNP